MDEHKVLQRLTTIETKVDGVESTIDKFDSKIDRLISVISDLKVIEASVNTTRTLLKDVEIRNKTSYKELHDQMHDKISYKTVVLFMSGWSLLFGFIMFVTRGV